MLHSAVVRSRTWKPRRSPSKRRRRVALVAWALTLALLLPSAAARASLAPGDRDELTRALRQLAEDRQDLSFVVAGRIFAKPEYDREDFEEFFRIYFERDPLTPPLAGYLLREGAVRKRASLQEALASVLVREIAALFDKYLPDRLGGVLERNSVTFAHLSSSLELLGRIAYDGDKLSGPSRRALYERLKELIASHPEVLRKDVTIDMGSQPKLAAVRARLYKSMQDLRDPFDRAGFVADAGFQGRYAELVLAHGVLVLDNNGFDDRQLRALQEVLALIPPRLHHTRHISQHGLLGNVSRREVEVNFTGSPGVNIFQTPVDGQLQNQFPADVAARKVPIFCSALQHELNHMVDWWAVREDPELSRRRDELLAQAEIQPMRYLRSTQPKGFFARHPQEFFASIANQYFTDSRHTLRLALQRFDKKWPEPLNQLLFFVEVYSQGGDRTLFFEQDEKCNYTATTVPVGRDAKGRIDRLRWQGTEFRFELDEAGNVLRRSEHPVASGPASGS